MFEVIIQANPQDCQSLEILKDAYQRIGREDDSLKIARKLADTYAELGQYSAAMLEYEAIIQKQPNSPEVIAALGEVEEKLQKSGQLKPQTDSSSAASSSSNISLDFQTMGVDSGSLTTTPNTLHAGGVRNEGTVQAVAAKLAGQADGNDALAKFLIQHKFVTEEVVSSALERVQKRNRELGANAIASSLIDEICRRGSVELDQLLCGIIDRSKFAYIPLEYYDVDRSVVKMLPDSLTLGRLMVPFDVMSRTIMIAVANPFDGVGKQAAQQLLDFNVQWHLAQPRAIMKVLSEAHRIAL
jgi:tetratricopeptide (TPR) repeat protein